MRNCLLRPSTGTKASAKVSAKFFRSHALNPGRTAAKPSAEVSAISALARSRIAWLALPWPFAVGGSRPPSCPLCEAGWTDLDDETIWQRYVQDVMDTKLKDGDRLYEASREAGKKGTGAQGTLCRVFSSALTRVDYRGSQG